MFCFHRIFKTNLFTALVFICISITAPVNTPAMSSGTVDVREFESLTEAVASPLSVGKTIVISSPVFCNSLTIPADRGIRILKGGAVKNTGTLTINGSFDAGRFRVFTGSGLVTGLHLLYPEWFGVIADDSGSGDGTPQNVAFAALSAAIVDNCTVSFAPTGNKYITVSGATASTKNILSVFDVKNKKNVRITGDNTKVFMSGFDASKGVTTGYYGSGIFFFIRLYRCEDCVISGFDGLGQFGLNEPFYQGKGILARASFIHINQSRRIRIENNRVKQIWGNLVNVQSSASGKPYVNWWPYEDVDIVNNHAEDCAENGFNYLGGGIGGKFIGNIAINCVALIENASHGLLIKGNIGYWRYDLGHRKSFDGTTKVTGLGTYGISNIGNDTVIEDNLLLSDIGWLTDGSEGAYGYLLASGILLRDQGGAVAPLEPWTGSRSKIHHNYIYGTYTQGIFVAPKCSDSSISGNYIVTQKQHSSDRAIANMVSSVQIANGQVVGIKILSGGAGYSYAPLVLIQGGGGKGAVARAILDDKGSVKSISIIKPGSGYNSPPVAKLVGGATGNTGLSNSKKISQCINLLGNKNNKLSRITIEANTTFCANYGIKMDSVDDVKIISNNINSAKALLYDRSLSKSIIIANNKSDDSEFNQSNISYEEKSLPSREFNRERLRKLDFGRYNKVAESLYRQFGI